MASIVEKVLPDVTGEGRHGQVTLDTWFDRLMKALTVWLPLLVSGTLFLGEITGEPQEVFCLPPSNFSIPQANYLNAFCKENLDFKHIMTSMFPTFVLLIALLMYIPHFLWKMMLGTKLATQISMIIKAIESSKGRIDNVAGLYYERFRHGIDTSAMKGIAGSQMPRYHLTVGLTDTRKWWTLLRAKLICLFVFALVCLAYLIWFDIVSQMNNVFLCSTKIHINSNNKTDDGEYLESLCKVIGMRHLFYVSVLLSIAFSIAVLLPVSHVMYIKLNRSIFLANILNALKDVAEEATPIKIKPLPTNISPFSDFSIIGRLLGENRHLISGLRDFIKPYGKSGKSPWVLDTTQHVAQHESSENAKESSNTGPKTGDESADFNILNLIEKNGDDSGAGPATRNSHPQLSSGSSSSDKKHPDQDRDDSGAGPVRGNIHDVEAEIHPQPSSGGTSPSIPSFHTEDETKVKGLAGQETVPLMAIQRRGRKNRSDTVEKETNV